MKATGNTILLHLPRVVFCLCVTFFTATCAQDVHNTSMLYTTPGLTVAISGSLTNDGFIQNQGQIALKGNWMNHSIYQGAGRISLTGANQTVFNNGQPIHHVVIDGGGVKTVRGKVIISAAIDFEDGIVQVEDLDTLVLKENVQINAASSLSYVEGALTASGTGYHFFPVGKSGQYHPIELLDVKGVAPTIEIEVFQNLPAIRTRLPVELFSDIYWKHTTINGSFDSSPVSLLYPVPPSVNDNDLVVADGNDPDEEFFITDDLNVKENDNGKIITTNKPITGNIIALGVDQGKAPNSFYFSTTLSPNASDPENRVVKVFGDNVAATDFLFEVYNRWGNLIYKNQSPLEMSTSGWDGKQNGQIVTSGVYPYSLKFQDVNGKREHRTGFITVIN